MRGSFTWIKGFSSTDNKSKTEQFILEKLGARKEGIGIGNLTEMPI